MPKNVMITECFVRLDFAPSHPETPHPRGAVLAKQET